MTIMIVHIPKCDNGKGGYSYDDDDIIVHVPKLDDGKGGYNHK